VAETEPEPEPVAETEPEPEPVAETEPEPKPVPIAAYAPEPEPVRQPAAAPSRKKRSRGRRRVRPWAVIASLVVAAVFAVGGLGIWEYLQLVDELHTSNKHVSNSVREELTPGGSMIASPQVTLIAGSAPSAGRTAISVVLLSTQPGHNRISTLYVPRSAQLPAGGSAVPTLDDAYRTGGLPLVTKTLRESLGTPINHVVALDLRQLVSMVDGLGGIVVHNPAAVSIPPQDNAPGATFAKGKVELDGKQAAIYMRSGQIDDAQDDAEQAARQGRVLTALVNRVLALPLSRAPRAASAVLKGTASDLTQSDMLGLIWLRYHSSTLTQCLLQGSASVSNTADTPVAGFLRGASTPGCAPRQLTSAPIPLPATVATLALWVLIVPAVLLVLGLLLVAGGIWWVRRRRRPAPVPDREWDKLTRAEPGPVPPTGAPSANGAPPPLPPRDELEAMSRAELFDLALRRGARHRELIVLDRPGILALLVADDREPESEPEPAAAAPADADTGGDEPQA